MATNRALIVQNPGEAKVTEAPIPKLRDDYITVKVAAVALNPTDWKHIDYMSTNGATVGCDYAGVVEEVGKSVTNGLKKGDRVAGMVHGVNHEHLEDGAFAQYITAKGDLQIKISDKISFEEAATLGVGITTVGQGLYESLKLPLPNEPTKDHTPVLVYGGSTATGSLAIQFAKLSGCEVITTCSKHNFDLVKGLGADHVFDYNSPTCGSDIRKVTKDNLKYVFDCISSDESAKICCDGISSSGGKLSTLIQVKKLPRDDVENLLTLAYSAIGEGFKTPAFQLPPKKEDFEFGVKFWKLAGELLEDGKFKVHPVSVQKGGLDGILDGLKDMKEGKNSGVKLVYKIT